MKKKTKPQKLQWPKDLFCPMYPFKQGQKDARKIMRRKLTASSKCIPVSGRIPLNNEQLKMIKTIVGSYKLIDIGTYLLSHCGKAKLTQEELNEMRWSEILAFLRMSAPSKMKKPIKWMRINEIRWASEESKKAAVICSIEHYKQMLSATQHQLMHAFVNGLTNINSKYCAICYRYLNNEDREHESCPLCSRQSKNCCREWQQINLCMGYWIRNYKFGRRSGFVLFRKSLKTMLERVEKIYGNKL